ncbi:MAG TPA: SpoIID/LytB domain-containing protein, partial [Phycisphaerales bacterium]|nr:SpoIID/LytB domain-containing protein [Phycisphaerales bacterium]
SRGEPEQAGTVTAPAPTGDIYKVAGIAGEPEMRVRIQARVPSVELAGTPEFAVTPLRGLVREGRQTVKGPLVFTLDEFGWVVQRPSGKPLRFSRDRDVEVVGLGDDPVICNGTMYPGRFRLTAATSGGNQAGDIARASEQARTIPAAPALAGTGAPGAAAPADPARVIDVIEHVPLEAYLPGVVAKELYEGWPAAAYQVQAVCARSYAIHERLRSMAAGRAFDVEATTRDQAYQGASAPPVARQAVESTRGLVMAYGDAVLRTYYSSTCGGRTASAKETWPITRGYEYNLAAPLQASARPSACQKSPLFTWRTDRDRADLARRLAAYGQKMGFMIRQIKDVQNVSVLAVNAVGRPTEYKVVDSDGKWYRLKAEELRLACNTDYPGSAPITRANRVNSGDLELVLEGSSVLIMGRGFGHGVGMCQFCTRGWAEQGEGYEQMLPRFYHGARLVRAY